MAAAAALVLSSLVFSPSALAADGDLDPTFGSGGIVTTDFVPPPNRIQALPFRVAVQSDGRIVAAGYAYFSTNQTGQDFALARYNSDGSADTTFGNGGLATTDFSNRSIELARADQAHGLALQADGKIVLAGQTVGAGFDFALARYNSDGSLDTTFGTGGKVTTDFSGCSYCNDIAYGVADQSDGKILVAGSVWILATGGDSALARYNSDGSLDTTFGTGGVVTVDFGTSDAWYDIALQPDGKIVVAGSALARYNSDGSADTTFGNGGIVQTAGGASLALQPDGRILVAGSTNSGTSFDFALARYNSDGSPDPTFGGGGATTTDFGSTDDLASGAALQGDGRIVVAGSALYGNPGQADWALARYNPDGSLDTSFGSGGKVTTVFCCFSYDTASGVAIQADGQILAAGGTQSGGWTLARYQSRELTGTTN